MSVRFLAMAAAVAALAMSAAEAQTSKRPVQFAPGGRQIAELQSLVTRGAVIRLGGFGLGSFGFGGYAGTPSAGGDMGYGGSGSSMPPVVVNMSPPPGALQVAQRSASEEHATVETTRQGVVIVRGPGSHHLER